MAKVSSIRKRCFRMPAVVRYHDGEMSLLERGAFLRHVEVCRDCRRSLEAAEVALGAFDAFLDQLAPPPFDVDKALRSLHRGEALARAERLGLRVLKGRA